MKVRKNLMVLIVLASSSCYIITDPTSVIPEIQDLSCDRTKVEPGIDNVLTCSLGMKDLDANCHLLVRAMTTPSGQYNEGQPVNIQAAEDKKEVVFQWKEHIDTEITGEYKLTCWMIDEGGNESNDLSIIITVSTQ